MASGCMNPPLNSEDARSEDAADGGSSKTCHQKVGAAAVIAAVTIVTGLTVFFVVSAYVKKKTFSVTCREAEVNQKTSEGERLEQLQQCQKERRLLNEMLKSVAQDSRCNLCPDRWLWWMGHCYFFSPGHEENLKWKESAEFCQRHNSSLLVIKDSAEMDFLQTIMAEFSQFPFLWLGLTDSQQEGQWLWWDGMDVQHYMPMSVEWDADHRDCADLRGDRSLFAVDCETYGPWACKRKS